MKNVQMIAKIRREKERRLQEALAETRDRMYGTGLSNIMMNEANGIKKKKKKSRSER